MSKTIGIIGGMGPLSTVELMHKVIRYTPAHRDQEHLHMLVDNRPQIPDRTAAILGTGPSPVALLQESARTLQRAGADFLAMACNTAHYFYEDVAASVHIPVVHMHRVLEAALKKHFSHGEKIALLATTGTLRAKIFQQHLPDFDFVVPDENGQEEWVMRAIYGEAGIKNVGVTHENTGLLLQAVKRLDEEKPAAWIAGCTEIEHALEKVELPSPLFLPLDLLARELVRQALN